ncbi:MAG TPA: twin-arginine translocase TatA/TatE family subunit [Paracoccaceae bacterium]|nr:twin-arginine translocase TatA/TatE family subunit [Paracoccaceae bacterium]
MGSFSIWHWLIVLVVVLVAFGGAGKIPRMMGDMAKGIKAFKSGMREDEESPPAQPPAQQPAQPAPAAQAAAQPEPAPQPAPAQQPRAHAQ